MSRTTRAIAFVIANPAGVTLAPHASAGEQSPRSPTRSLASTAYSTSVAANDAATNDIDLSLRAPQGRGSLVFRGRRLLRRKKRAPRKCAASPWDDPRCHCSLNSPPAVALLAMTLGPRLSQMRLPSPDHTPRRYLPVTFVADRVSQAYYYERYKGTARGFFCRLANRAVSLYNLFW
jgi:hypothetical protein